MTNRNTYRRKNSLRLKNYDYSKQGLYFLTVCVQHRLHLLGHVENGEMICNDAGIMIYKWYHELENKFPTIHCDVAQVMPNHFHCIIEITGNGRTDADTDITKMGNNVPQIGTHVGTPLRGCPGNNNGCPGNNNGCPDNNNGCPGNNNGCKNDNAAPNNHRPSIPTVMEWYKTMTTNKYIRGVKQHHWQRFDGKLWQRSYHDHIIRDEQSYERIRNYIINNPQNWDNDKFNKNNDI